MPINLIDHRQETVGPFALAPVDLVNADRSNPLQLPMSQPPLDEPFHRVVNRLPTGLERSGPSLATTAAAPSGPGIPSWPWSPAVCLGSRECARRPHRAPRIPLVAAGRRSGTQFPTAARRASSARAVGHSLGRALSRWNICREGLGGAGF